MEPLQDIPHPPVTGHPVFDAIAWLLGGLIFLLFPVAVMMMMRELTWRKERSKAIRNGDAPPGYVSSSSVTASNERLARHLHDIAEICRDLSATSSDMAATSRATMKEIEELRKENDRSHEYLMAQFAAAYNRRV